VTTALSLLDELMAPYVALSRNADPTATSAKASKAANPEHPGALQADPGACEGMRIPAKSAPCSQTFATLRNPQDRPPSEQPRGSSQDSQDSQGCRPAIESTRFARLLRWGWSAAEAEALAERLTRRDREDDDDRVSCTDCNHYGPGRCGNYRRAGLHGPEVGRDLAAILQRCPGFQSSR
jgi:hypothetical protein